ncbi:MAG: hypothetical protein JNN30_20260 [Rhodanobacteraceae bacterium]|nr:hypothetical protein [Rhodanobacteraceae bacterium]
MTSLIRSTLQYSAPTSRSLTRVLTALAWTLLAGSVSAAAIAVDETLTEPLAGRDYSMRLDLAAARFEQIDTQTGEIRTRMFSAECAAALAPGLWLAAPAAGSLELLPLGATADVATLVAAGCRTQSDQAATLPPALLQQIAAGGGGVIYVDAAGLDSSTRIAASGAR